MIFQIFEQDAPQVLDIQIYSCGFGSSFPRFKLGMANLLCNFISQGFTGIAQYYYSFFLARSLSTCPSRDQSHFGIQDFSQK